MLSTNLGSRAVYIEGFTGYDTSSVHKDTLYKSSSDKCQNWVFDPGDSPWHQGAVVEALFKSAIRCLKFSMENQRLSASEFMNIFHETANILNEMLLGQMPCEDSDVNILTPSSLLLGRGMSTFLDSSTADMSSLKNRIGLVNPEAQRFWTKLVELYAPTMINQTKWSRPTRNFQVGNVVSVCDANALRSQYYIAQIKEVCPDKKGMRRRVLLRYKNYKVSDGKIPSEYRCAGDVLVTRSVQGLALLVPAESV